MERVDVCTDRERAREREREREEGGAASTRHTAAAAAG